MAYPYQSPVPSPYWGHPPCACVVSLPHMSNIYGTYSERQLPLLDINAKTTIFSTTSRTVLKQVFANPTQNVLEEVAYRFPLYDGVSVVDFTCRVGDRVLLGLVREKDEARKDYEDAKAQGQQAALFVQSRVAADVFETKVGNVPAKDNVIVEITYVGELKHDVGADAIRFTIPNIIAPRYGAPLDLSIGQSSPQPKGLRVAVDIQLEEGGKVTGVQSSSHPIAVTMGSNGATPGQNTNEFDPSKASATLALVSTELGQDFVLMINATGISTPRALLETHPSIPGQRALMVSLIPKFNLPQIRPEIIFVADRSGSMDDKIRTLTSALQVFLRSLPEGVKFNICSFGSSFQFLWPKSKLYDQDALTSASTYVSSFDSSMGGTELLNPMLEVLKRRYKDLPLEIIVLTDGQIYNQESFFEEVRKGVSKYDQPTRIFSLGLGRTASHSLVEGLADAANGFAQVVGEDEELDSKVVRMLKGALSPHITDYKLEVNYESSQSTSEDDRIQWEAVDTISDQKYALVQSEMAPRPLDSSRRSTRSNPISLFDESIADDEVSNNVPETPQNDGLPIIAPPNTIQTPHKIPSLYAFVSTVVYLLLSPETQERIPKAVTLKATSSHGPLEIEIPVQTIPTPQDTVHKLAVKRATGELEKERGSLFAATDEGGVPLKERFEGRWEEVVKKEAVRLGTRFQVAGKYCSFVAVEANAERIAKILQDRQQEASQRSEGSPSHQTDQSSSFPSTRPHEYPSTADSSTGSSSWTSYRSPDDTPDALSDTSSIISTGTMVSLNSLMLSDTPKGNQDRNVLKEVLAKENSNTKYSIPVDKDLGVPHPGGLRHFLQARTVPTAGPSGFAPPPLPPPPPGPMPGYSQLSSNSFGSTSRGSTSPKRFNKKAKTGVPLAGSSVIDAVSTEPQPSSSGSMKSFRSARSPPVPPCMPQVLVQPQQQQAPPAFEGAQLLSCSASHSPLQNESQLSQEDASVSDDESQLPEEDASAVSTMYDRLARLSSPRRYRMASTAPSLYGAAAPVAAASASSEQADGVNKPKTEREQLHVLVSEQTFKGCWKLSPHFLRILGMTGDAAGLIRQIRDACGSAKDIDDTLATLFAVCLLKTKFSTFAETWELVVDKARRWLDTSAPEQLLRLENDITHSLESQKEEAVDWNPVLSQMLKMLKETEMR